jgi:hypothetical protein
LFFLSLNLGNITPSYFPTKSMFYEKRIRKITKHIITNPKISQHHNQTPSPSLHHESTKNSLNDEKQK